MPQCGPEGNRTTVVAPGQMRQRDSGSLIMIGMRKANAGVTLMELLTVVVIVGILSAIAIPSYRGYVIRANRADAKTGLLATAGSLERCFTRDNTYATCNLTL